MHYSNKKDKNKNSESVSPDSKLFRSKDVANQESLKEFSLSSSPSKYDEKEVRLIDNDLDDEFDNEGNMNVQLNKLRSTAIVEKNDNLTNSELSSLRLYRNNTESDLTKFKEENKANNKELMQVYEKYSNIKQDNMFDIIKRHESISSDSSGKDSPQKTERRSTKKKDNNTNSQNDTSGYSNSNMNNLNIKKGKLENKKFPDQPKSIFGCFSCFRK